MTRSNLLVGLSTAGDLAKSKGDCFTFCSRLVSETMLKKRVSAPGGLEGIIFLLCKSHGDQGKGKNQDLHVCCNVAEQ